MGGKDKRLVEKHTGVLERYRQEVEALRRENSALRTVLKEFRAGKYVACNVCGYFGHDFEVDVDGPNGHKFAMVCLRCTIYSKRYKEWVEDVGVGGEVNTKSIVGGMTDPTLLQIGSGLNSENYDSILETLVKSLHVTKHRS